MQTSYQTIIFDMDGVITNTMPRHYRIWKYIFKLHGVEVSKHEIYRREGQKGIESIKEIFAHYGKPFSFQKGHEILAQKEQLFKGAVSGTRFIQGARTFIKDMAGRGRTLALVTGTSRHEVEQLLPVDLLNRFSVIVTGSDVKNGKPHPEPYLKALKALMVAPEEAVVIENAPFGITSAKSAGLKCFAIETSLPKTYLKDANKTFKNMKELHAFFLQVAS